MPPAPTPYNYMPNESVAKATYLTAMQVTHTEITKQSLVVVQVVAIV